MDEEGAGVGLRAESTRFKPPLLSPAFSRLQPQKRTHPHNRQPTHLTTTPAFAFTHPRYLPDHLPVLGVCTSALGCSFYLAAEQRKLDLEEGYRAVGEDLTRRGVTSR
ncbi:hypothetical protein C8F01DRAFT_1366776 [Mycena amicta]|nr:hypothetical protein C8F01DRAFT_1366776 [Mycena amicta]